MRKLFLNVTPARSVTGVCLVFMLLFFSCSPDDEVITKSGAGDHEKLVQFLVNSGFNRDEIVFEDGIFVIDDDILITKEEVEGYIALDNNTPDNGRAQHYRGTYLVSDTYVTNIKFYISSSVPSSWAAAVRDAIVEWNNVNGTKLLLSEVSSSSSANTIINTAYSSSNWVARAYLPSYSRRPGHTLTINTRFNSLDTGRKLFTMVHEMGHIFGLYHTNQTQGIFIQGTPVTDANSVMNSFVLPWNGFTTGDVSAVQIIYPQ